MATKKKPKDDNDRLKDGTLNPDPFADAEPFGDEPKKATKAEDKAEEAKQDAYQFKVGDVVRAADKDNQGTIVSISGEVAEVLFVNRDKGTSQTVKIPLAKLKLAYGNDAPINPVLQTDAPLVGEFYSAAIERMFARHRGDEKPIPLPIDTMAKALRGGLWPGLHILVGNTGSGKSALALQIALNAAQDGVPVLYVGLELGEVDLVARLLGLLESQHSNARAPKWSDLFLGEHDGIAQIADRHAATMASLPFRMAFAPPMGWDYRNLHPLASQLKEQHQAEKGKHQPLLIVLDFLQLVAGTERELRERIGRAAYAGRAIARELDAAVLFISSTSRENYGRLDGEVEGKGNQKGPSLGKGSPVRFVGMGKESGEVEYSADSVLVLCREQWKGEKPPTGGTRCWLAVAKQRVGPPAWVELRFNGSYFSKAIAGVDETPQGPDAEF